MIELTYDQRDLAALLARLNQLPNGLAAATSRAINRTLTSTRAEMVRMIRADYDLRAGDIRKELRISKSTQKTMTGRIDGESSPGIPLIRFARIRRVPSTIRTRGAGYSPKVGVPVLIRRDKGRIAARGVFLARMASGHEGAFLRADPASSGRAARGGSVRVGQSRAGNRYIREVYGPSPLKLLTTDANMERIEDYAQDVMDKNIQHEADFYLRQAGV